MVTPSRQFGVKVITSGDPDDVETRVSGDILEIRQASSSWFSWNDQVKVLVSMPYLDNLSASGGSDVESNGQLRGEKLRLKASGGADVSLEVAYEWMEVNTSGGSDVELKGTTGLLELSCSGGSDFDGCNLMAAEADLHTSGGADACISVDEKLYARASGASDITYYGSPRIVDADTSGGADIRGRSR